MRVLVTGATGRVGTRLVPRLLRNGNVSMVRALARDPARAETLEKDGLEVVMGDLQDPTARREALAGLDAVVHLAAALRGVDPAIMPLVNRDATVALAEDAIAAGAGRFIYVSTNLVYGEGGNRAFVEDDPLQPGTVYGIYPQTKADAERALLELHDGMNLPVRILRLAFVYGEQDPHLGEALWWAKDWARHRRLHMVHHADVAQAVLLMLLTHGIDGNVYNVADDAAVTAAELFELNGLALPPEPTTEVEHPWEGIVSTRKIKDDLGFRPIYPTAWSAWAAGAL